MKLNELHFYLFLGGNLLRSFSNRLLDGNRAKESDLDDDSYFVVLASNVLVNREFPQKNYSVPLD